MTKCCNNCKVGPGAYEAEPAETAILEWYSLNGHADDILHGEGLPAKDVFVGPVEVTEDAAKYAHDKGFCAMHIAIAAQGLETCKSATFFIDDNGFRSSEVHSKC
jgi:hypothetical protein